MKKVYESKKIVFSLLVFFCASRICGAPVSLSLYQKDEKTVGIIGIMHMESYQRKDDPG